MARSTIPSATPEPKDTESFNPFGHFVPNEDDIPAITQIRKAFRRMQLYIEDYCPPSRARSVALTELETAAMWAIKSIVIQDFLPTPPSRNF